MPIVTTDDIANWLIANNLWPGQQTFQAATLIRGPIVSAEIPTYREIIVDPNGLSGGYSTLASALSYVAGVTSPTNQWTIRLLPGTYLQTAVLTVPSYCSIVGAGQRSTIIKRTTALANSVTANGLPCDPVIFTSGTDVGLRGLTVQHAGTPASGFVCTALCTLDADFFTADSVRFESTNTGLNIGRSVVPTVESEQTTVYLTDCFLTVTNQAVGLSNDAYLCNTADVHMVGCVLTLTGVSVSSSDVMRQAAGRLFMKSCDVTHRMTSTLAAVCSCLAIGNQSVTVGDIHLQGCRFLFDISGGDINSATVDCGVVDFRSTLLTGAFNFYAEDCEFLYKTGTVTLARTISGLHVGQTGSNATIGSFFLTGSNFRDLGGSGGTIRKNLVIDAVSVHIAKEVRQHGCRIGSWEFRTSSPPTITSANYGVTENSINFQSGIASFASAATSVVTLPIPYPANPSALTDYMVSIEPSVNETFWITAKTNTGFTINSSNGASTAVIDWTVTR